MIFPFLLVFSRTDVVIDRDGIRKDLKGWNFQDVIKIASQYEKGFRVLVELLDDYDSTVRKNALYVIQDLIKENLIDGKRLKLALEKIIKLADDPDESVSLRAIETLNLILEKVELDPESYEMVTNALMKIVKSGKARFERIRS